MQKILTSLSIFLLLVTNITCTKTNSEITAVDKTNASSVEELLPVAAATTVTYRIPKGEQYCKPNPLVFTTDSLLSFTARFDSSCIYKTVNPANQDDINKLYGFSDCGTHHLDNSARIGWRWSKDSLRLFGFVHNNGTMLFKEITTATIGKAIKCKIICRSSSYKFTVNGKTVSLPRHCSGNYTRYKLYPYFGGDEVAPHKIVIKLTDLN